MLLAASLVFTSGAALQRLCGGCGLLAVSSFVSYLAANTLRKHRRKSVLLAVVCYHIAVLGIFKYTGFFTGGAVRMPFVPLGISFFTFQQIWYLREVYAGTFSQVPTPAEYLTYSFFFPHGVLWSHLEAGEFLPPSCGRPLPCPRIPQPVCTPSASALPKGAAGGQSGRAGEQRLGQPL